MGFKSLPVENSVCIFTFSFCNVLSSKLNNAICLFACSFSASEPEKTQTTNYTLHLPSENKEALQLEIL